jgi:hypothetical protein
MGVGEGARGPGKSIKSLAVKATRLHRNMIVRITPLANYGRYTLA